MITGGAERRPGIPRDVSGYSLTVALDLDGKLGHESLEFLRRVMTLAATIRSTRRQWQGSSPVISHREMSPRSARDQVPV
jgi:hypothetical protein